MSKISERDMMLPQMRLRRLQKGDILKYSNLYYLIDETETFVTRYPRTSTTFTAGQSNKYKIEEVEPRKNYLTHINKIGINSYLEIQLYLPERQQRGSVQGVNRLTYQIAPHQNPYKFQVIVPENYPPYLDIYNPKSYDIVGVDLIYFFGYLYSVRPLGSEKPMGDDGKPLPYIEVSDYVPLA